MPTFTPFPIAQDQDKFYQLQQATWNFLLNNLWDIVSSCMAKMKNKTQQAIFLTNYLKYSTAAYEDITKIYTPHIMVNKGGSITIDKFQHWREDNGNRYSITVQLAALDKEIKLFEDQERSVKQLTAFFTKRIDHFKQKKARTDDVSTEQQSNESSSQFETSQTL